MGPSRRAPESAVALGTTWTITVEDLAIGR
jgi:hypothetical protein